MYIGDDNILRADTLFRGVSADFFDDKTCDFILCTANALTTAGMDAQQTIVTIQNIVQAMSAVSRLPSCGPRLREDISRVGAPSAILYTIGYVRMAQRLGDRIADMTPDELAMETRAELHLMGCTLLEGNGN